MVEVPRIVNRAEAAGCAGAFEGHFVEIEFCEEDNAGGFEAAGDFGIFLWDSLFEDAGCSGGADAGCIDIVFESDGDAIEATQGAPGAAAMVGLFCLGESALFVESDDGVERRIEFVNAGQAEAR